MRVIYRSVAGDYSSSLIVRMAMINAIRSVCCQLQVIGVIIYENDGADRYCSKARVGDALYLSVALYIYSGPKGLLLVAA